MSKIIKNTTASVVDIPDVGVSVQALDQYTIPPMDYLLWAQSSNIISLVGAGTLVVNDGSVDLGISDGVDYIKGVYQKTRLIGNTNGILIGNVEDKLKVHVEFPTEIEIKNDTGNPVPISGNITATLKSSNIQCNAEFSINSRNETDIAGVSYTVSSGKLFYLTYFAVTSDSPSPVAMRLRVYDGVNLINTIKINIASNSAWGEHSLPNGVLFASAGNVIKATFDPQAAKGSGWAMFAGFEI